MEDLLDNDTSSNEIGRIKKIVNSSLITLYLLILLFCHSVFHSTPSLGYLILFYAAAFLILLSVPIVLLQKSSKRPLSFIGNIGSIALLLVASFNTADNISLMQTGQILTLMASALTVLQYLLVWKKEK